VLNSKIYVVSRASLYCYNLGGEEQYVNHVSSNITAITNVDLPAGSKEVDDVIVCTD
jgi:hypothetical protein